MFRRMRTSRISLLAGVAGDNGNTKFIDDAETRITDQEPRQEGRRYKALSNEALTMLTISSQRLSVLQSKMESERRNKAVQVLTAVGQKLHSLRLTASATFLQKQPAAPSPPFGFKEYKNNESAGGVMGMIQQIINDAKAVETEATRSEEDAQKAYEDFVKETNASVEEKAKTISKRSEEKTKDNALTTLAQTNVNDRRLRN